MPLTLFEPFRAVFYTPFYAAHALGAYGAEGVDVNLVTAGAAETVSGLIAGDTDVSWGGPMRIQQTYDQHPDCDIVSFCEIVTRDPFFLVGRTPRPDFQPSDLMNIRLGSVAEVTTPWLCLQEDMRRVGLDPTGVNRTDKNLMAENVAALRAGDMDVIQVFQPFAEQLVADGDGYIWYAAASRGPASYTTLSTLKNTLQSKRDSMMRMTRALYRTQKWLHGSEAPAIAAAIADFFPDLSQDILAASIHRYKSLDLWGANPILPRDGFDRLKASGLSGGLFTTGAPYEACVDTSLAQSVIEADPPSM
jgi:NitT/TauT family transport system substrate-binding protein